MARRAVSRSRQCLPTAVGVVVCTALALFVFVNFFAYSNILVPPGDAGDLSNAAGPEQPVSENWRSPAAAEVSPSAAEAVTMPIRPEQSVAHPAGDSGATRQEHHDLIQVIDNAPAPTKQAEQAPAPKIDTAQISWKKHEGKSCQGYANGDATERTLSASKEACLNSDGCVAVVCPHGKEVSCTMRSVANLVNYGPEDCYEQLDVATDGSTLSVRVHPEYNSLLKHYPFQQVITQTGQQVNIILVRSQMSGYQKKLFQQYKDKILFMGISSMNDYPLNSDGKTTSEFIDMFPGFLHMMRDPEKYFPPKVKTILMSQSDFQLPEHPPRDYSMPKKYDFTFSGSDCDVHSDCTGWCGWSKNWSFVKEALPIMCGRGLTGVLVASKDKQGRRACSIPANCQGKITQTSFLTQEQYFHYLKNSRFAFLPQVHDASPRVSTQALALDVPVLMNYNIQGGWKYVNNNTGEFFHDIHDFPQSLDRILRKADIKGGYEPRNWVLANYGNPNSGKRLLEFVQKNFLDHVKLPKRTKLLVT